MYSYKKHGAWIVVAILQDGTEAVLERNIMYEHTAILIAAARRDADKYRDNEFYKVYVCVEGNHINTPDFGSPAAPRSCVNQGATTEHERKVREVKPATPKGKPPVVPEPDVDRPGVGKNPTNRGN